MIDYDAPDFSNKLVRRGTSKGNIESIDNLTSANKAAADMQFCSSRLNRIIGMRDTQTFLHHAKSSLKPIT